MSTDGIAGGKASFEQHITETESWNVLMDGVSGPGKGGRGGRMSTDGIAGGKASFEQHITKTEFWNELMDDVFGARKGGAIIFVDAENARKGVAKTSGAVALARLIARAFRYDIQKDDMTLSGSHYLQRYQEHPGHDQPSVLVLDEFVGAGSGDGRRAMSNQNVDFGKAWQLLRTKRVVTLATLPDWNEADTRLQKYADYRVWCREKPIGYFQPYKVTVPFNASGSGGKTQTNGLSYDGVSDRIRFPNMDAEGDPYYHHLSEKKDELIHSSTWDADTLGEDGEGAGEAASADDIQRRELVKVAIRLYKPWDKDTTRSYEEVADAIAEKSDTWVGNRVREWKNGEHRELVPNPQEE
ncbi:ATP-binding protein [Halosegnis rubeus]|jgi:hypothetical protein|uniref:ATP-binding protein n=1 Tax=Halosegnis rubeus TaxID=2212850 RepID=A0A5N5UJ83_9EURY|nr:ATP-binding protein [Halosegnis rubeus]KAB7518795.1 ATP-binding protein [Halosegnis rubeus]